MDGTHEHTAWAPKVWLRIDPSADSGLKSWEPAEWARCTARQTRSSGAPWPSRFCRRTMPADASRRSRFEREARAAAALNHPNIVTVYDSGVEAEAPWIAMEYVEGRTLRRLLQDGPLGTDQILGIAIPVADALAKAHESGVIHRDLKPENIMITADGTPKILDFGLARVAATPTDDTQWVTEPDAGVGGTLGYLAPEQLLGKPSDHRSDQFAFGIVLFELAKGGNPFRRESGPQTIAATLESAAHLIAGPKLFGAVVNRCLEKDPGRRYQSTRDLASELKAVRQPVAAPVRRRRGCGRSGRFR